MQTSELNDLKARKSEVVKESRAAQQNFQVSHCVETMMNVSLTDVSSQEASDRVQGLRQKVSSSRQRVDEAKSSQASNKSSNHVLDNLTKLQHTGRIAGFHVRDINSLLHPVSQ